MATVNKLLKAINTQLNNNPSLSEVEDAIDTLQAYKTIRRTVEKVFTNYGEETRLEQVDQYFQIRRLLETFEITFPTTKTDNQATSVKYFNLEWKGNKAARLYWIVSDGWSVEHKDFSKDLKGVWEGFDLEDTLNSNDIYFTESVDD